MIYQIPPNISRNGNGPSIYRSETPNEIPWERSMPIPTGNTATAKEAEMASRSSMDRCEGMATSSNKPSMVTLIARIIIISLRRRVVKAGRHRPRWRRNEGNRRSRISCSRCGIKSGDINMFLSLPRRRCPLMCGAVKVVAVGLGVGLHGLL